MKYETFSCMFDDKDGIYKFVFEFIHITQYRSLFTACEIIELNGKTPERLFQNAICNRGRIAELRKICLSADFKEMSAFVDDLYYHHEFLTPQNNEISPNSEKHIGYNITYTVENMVEFFRNNPEKLDLVYVPTGYYLIDQIDRHTRYDLYINDVGKFEPLGISINVFQTEQHIKLTPSSVIKPKMFVADVDAFVSELKAGKFQLKAKEISDEQFGDVRSCTFETAIPSEMMAKIVDDHRAQTKTHDNRPMKFIFIDMAKFIVENQLLGNKVYT